MPSLEDYLFAMEALSEDLVAAALTVLDLAASGSGVCGVVTAGQGLPLPALSAAGTGAWSPAAACRLPVPTAAAVQNGWLPAWGAPVLSLASAAGTGSVPALAEVVLVPLFALARGGAGAWITLPMTALGLSDPDRRAAGEAWLPGLSGRGRVCSLESPALTGTADSSAVVALLGVGDPELAEAAAGLPPGDDDARAGGLLALVASNLVYVSDAGDAWRCASATWALGEGDCEDGAILLHGLLLAAGLPGDRVVTAFGRVGPSREGHAWVAWRRRCDGRWAALDWTLGPGQGAVAALPVMGDPNAYAWVDHVLTSAAFFNVRQDAATFFAAGLAGEGDLPRAACRASATHGARGTAALPASATVVGQAGAWGRLELAAAVAAGAAGYDWSEAVWPTLAALGLAGSAGGAGASSLRAAGLGGGGGSAAASPAALACRGQAVQAALTAGDCLVRPADPTAWGLSGLLGGGEWTLRPILAAGLGLAGGRGLGATGLAVPACRGVGRPESLGLAFFALRGLAAAGRGRGSGGRLGRRGEGEEWA